MKELYQDWKTGCRVLFRFFWFTLVLYVILCPLYILQHFLMKDADAGVINEMLEGGFHAGPAIFLLFFILYLPFASLIAGRCTGYFQEPKNETQQSRS